MVIREKCAGRYLRASTTAGHHRHIINITAYHHYDIISLRARAMKNIICQHHHHYTLHMVNVKYYDIIIIARCR